MFTKSFTNELIPASWERAGSGSEPSRNTPPSGWSLAASASCDPSQSQLLEGTLCFAPGTFFYPQYVDLYSSPSCNDLHSAVYPPGGLPVTDRIGNWMPVLQRQQENNCPPWGPSNASLTTCGEAWNATIHHSHLWAAGDRSKCNTGCSAWHQENYHSFIPLCGSVASKQAASQLALVVKNPPSNAREIRDLVSAPRLGRSPGGGHDNPLQYSCLENPMDREGGLQSMGSQRVGHDWSDLAQQLQNFVLSLIKLTHASWGYVEVAVQPLKFLQFIFELLG